MVLTTAMRTRKRARLRNRRIGRFQRENIIVRFCWLGGDVERGVNIGEES